jgi:hypothetical protein
VVIGTVLIGKLLPLLYGNRVHIIDVCTDIRGVNERFDDNVARSLIGWYNRWDVDVLSRTTYYDMDYRMVLDLDGQVDTGYTGRRNRNRIRSYLQLALDWRCVGNVRR